MSSHVELPQPKYTVKMILEAGKAPAGHQPMGITSLGPWSQVTVSNSEKSCRWTLLSRLALPHSCQALFSIFYQVLPTVLLRVQSSIIHYQVGEFTSVCLGIYLHIFKSGIYGGQNINHTPSPIKLLQILKVKVTAKKWDLFPSCHFFQSVNS